MNPGKSPPPRDANEQVSALIETLQETEQRLEELTTSEVDAAADRDGRAFLLQGAEEQIETSERRRKQVTLAESEAGLRRAQLMANLAHVITGPDGSFEQWSETLPQLIGVEPAQLPRTSRAWLEILHPDDRPLFRDKAIEAAVKKLRMELEYRLRRADGEWIHLRQTMEPLKDEGDASAGSRWFNTLQDVTAQRRIEESLRASESRFRQMAENIRDVFFLQNLDSSQIYYVSPAYEQIWGRTCESLYANPMSWAESIHPDDLHHAFTQFTEVRNTEFDYEFRIVRPDGVMRWIHVRGFPVLDDAGNPYRSAGVASDITQRKQAAEDLRRSESLKGAILESSLDSLITIDHEGKIVEFNPVAAATFGFTREQVLGKAMVDLIVPPRLRDAHRRGFAHYLATGTGPVLGKRLELEAIRADGTEFPVELAIAALRGTSTPMFTGFIRDITARKEADEKIRRLNRVYAVLSGINSLIVRVGDRDKLFREACQVAVEHGQFRMAWIGVVDRSAMKIVPIASAGAEPEFLTLIKDRFSLRADAPLGNTMTARAVREKKAMVSNEIRDDPRVLFVKERIERGISSMAILPLLVSDDVVGVLALYANEPGFFDDEEMKLLTELAGDIGFALDHIEKEEKLNYLAYYDALTGLANRSLFLERLAQYTRSAVSGGHKLALYLLDLERFKNINDSLGRPAGDALLKQVAEWLTSNVGDASLLARVGADHFAVVVPEIKHEEEVARALEKTMEAFLDHPFHLNDAIFRIAAKVGVALFPDDGATADTLFKHAEAALKKAKASGDRYLFYTQKMTEAMAGKLTLENQLRQALDKEEFVLHYQPKVSLQSGKLTSAEALIRWNDPRSGLVPPGRFIPILEETGLIFEVGRWALRKALEDYLRWRAAGLAAVRIAVNVSPLQLRHRGFIAEIEQAIGIDAQAAAGLELEITESMIMEDVKHSIASLQAIRAVGVTIAIDDFGTGFSSLGYLSKLPVDTLKIDRSFVTDMTAGPDGLALVSTIITLAHSLRLKVVAEGVETEEQSRLLRLLKCDEMQGFLFSKPVPCEVFETRFLAPVIVRDLVRGD
jgi:diguanylate cyclase (GGDEF)-like protein/PAS domain S-box-containing protein